MTDLEERVERLEEEVGVEPGPFIKATDAAGSVRYFPVRDASVEVTPNGNMTFTVNGERVGRGSEKGLLWNAVTLETVPDKEVDGL